MIEERHAEYDQMIRKMIGDKEGYDKKVIANNIDRMMLTDAEILTEQNGVSWYDLVPLDSVEGWQNDYLELLQQALEDAQGSPALPKLTTKIELGIKAVTQRMHEWEEYPPSPVREAEETFFKFHFKIMKSDIVGENNLGIISRTK